MEQKTGLPSKGEKKITRRNPHTLTPVKLKKKNNQQLCVKYYLEGLRMLDVAERINEETGQTISVATVCKYIKEATIQWRQDQNEFIESHKAIELERINNLEAEYWAAWAASKQDQITIANKIQPGKRVNSKGKITDTIETTRNSTGEVRFLNGVGWCIEKRLELLGPTVLPVADSAGQGNVYNTYIRRVVFTNKAQSKQLEAAAEVIKIQPSE